VGCRAVGLSQYQTCYIIDLIKAEWEKKNIKLIMRVYHVVMQY
jgi:hypothetical protein